MSRSQNSSETRRYQIRENVFSLGDNFGIKDESGRDIYYVRSALFSFGDKLVLEDMNRNKLLKIREDACAFLTTFKIMSFQSNKILGTVQQKCSWCFPEFTIDSIYGRYEFNGDLTAHSFTLRTDDGRLVATVSKTFFAFSDTYGVEIAGGEDHAFILALVIVLDQTLHDKN